MGNPGNLFFRKNHEKMKKVGLGGCVTRVTRHPPLPGGVRKSEISGRNFHFRVILPSPSVRVVTFFEVPGGVEKMRGVHFRVILPSPSVRVETFPASSGLYSIVVVLVYGSRKPRNFTFFSLFLTPPRNVKFSGFPGFLKFSLFFKFFLVFSKKQVFEVFSEI
jgi:hypothetical protein